LVFGTVSDPLVAAALWTGCGAFATSLSLLAAIAVMRWRLLRRLAREARLAARWNPLIAECAERAPERVPAVAARDAETGLMLWARAQETLRGDARRYLVQLATRSGLDRHAERLLRSRRPSRRLLAIVVFGHLGDAGKMPLLDELVSGAGSLASLTAAHAMLRIDESRGVARLLAAAPRRDDWPIGQVAAILRDADPARVAVHLVAAIRTELRDPGDGPGLAQLVRLHGTAHAESMRPAVLEVLAHASDTEALAAALGALWHPADAERARAHLAHPEWIVRVAAAHALRRVGAREDLPRLARLLADGNWWVRHRAAQAICALPGVPLEEIRALVASVGDRFAADALVQAMADRAP
jgi:HEAT repeat protein